MTVQPAPKHFLPGLPRSATTALAPLQREFNRLLDEFASGWNTFTDFELAPSMDIRETAEAVEATIELPGIALEDIKVELDDNVLTIHGEKKSETDEKSENRRIAERVYGAFTRSIVLPSSVEADKITATMDKGVLKVVAPKDGQAKTRTIPVKSAK